jgi:hypothetical protein
MDEGDTEVEEGSMQRWHDAEQRLSTEPAAADHEPDFDLLSGLSEEADTDPDFGLDGENVDSATAQHFWGAVVLANVAVAGVSLGVMLIGFRGQWTVGGALILGGLLAGYRTYSVYRRFRADRETEDEADDAGDEPDTDSDASGDESESA